MKIIKIIISSIGLLILAFFVLLKLNLYPVAFTSNWLITEKQLDKITAASLVYYQKTLSVYAAGTPIIGEELKKEIKRAALDKMIEDKIIEDTLTKKLGAEKLKKSVNEKLANLSLNGEIANASQILYNLSLNDFRDLVLTPEAKREILKEQGIDLREIKKSCHPIILAPGFYWQGGVLAR
ncbi:MAG: hypothetical protein Q8N22_00855 [bacterium]|nr:hypothetical protein [bacterium]